MMGYRHTSQHNRVSTPRSVVGRVGVRTGIAGDTPAKGGRRLPPQRHSCEGLPVVDWVCAVSTDDHYRTLGIAPDASADQVRQAYRDVAKAFHPDRFADARDLLTVMAQQQTEQLVAASTSASDGGVPYLLLVTVLAIIWHGATQPRRTGPAATGALPPDDETVSDPAPDVSTVGARPGTSPHTRDAGAWIRRPRGGPLAGGVWAR